ncbi:MAG: carbonic anhydrase [Pseudomonadota bacterium]
MKRGFETFLAGILAAGLAGMSTPGIGADSGRWTYAGPTGPAKWGSLEKDFVQCTQGKNQSPIDIPDNEARKGDLPPLLFAYKPSPLRIVDNGHTIQVSYAPDSWVTVAGRRYELIEFHFHKPSEEKISGKSHDMVAHLVHRDKEGKLAVVAILLDSGKENALIKTLWSRLPQGKGKEVVDEAVKINALGLLPQNKGYYAFAGSLTTPPCSENVAWYVLKTPVEISADEIARFARLYPMNARPVQPLNGRDIQSTP